ncbi:MAG: hypothetical protein P8P30_09430 [Rickettsiales bacterium]|nr:hypothetical protein [Rickettsiales bacterium]
MQRFLSPKIIEKITSSESNLSNKAIGVESLSNLSHWCWAKQEQALLN